MNPLSKVHRWSKEARYEIEVPMPNTLVQYNKKMGGVDLHDQFVANYRIRIRSKKWWWSLFAWTINSSNVNAWLFFRKLGNNISLLDFTRHCTQHLLTQCKVERVRPGPSPSEMRIRGAAGEEIRYDGIGHWPCRGQSKYGRCKNCGSRSTMNCEKCKVPLHPECMKSYHTVKDS